MTMSPTGRPLRIDKGAIAVKAARAVLDENVTRQDAQKRFQIGWYRLRQAIEKLRAERAARSTP